MTFLQRNELIEALEQRGFKEVVIPNGWLYRHADGFTLSFRANGLFELVTQCGQIRAIAKQPSDILTIIDEAAAAL